jgi:hypothetical protein
VDLCLSAHEHGWHSAIGYVTPNDMSDRKISHDLLGNAVSILCSRREAEAIF